MRFLCLQNKDVINASSGAKLGFVSDLEINICNLCIEAIIVERFSPLKFLSLVKGPPVFVIPINQVITIGEDVIIVNVEN